MNKLTLKLLILSILLVPINGCQPKQITNILVDTTEPVHGAMERETFDLENCGSVLKISHTLGFYSTITKEVEVDGVAINKSRVEYEITALDELQIIQAIIDTYAQTYETEITRLENETIEAGPNEHISFVIEKEKLTFSDKLKFSLNKEVYDLGYKYELTTPKLIYAEYKKCPESNTFVTNSTPSLDTETPIALEEKYSTKVKVSAFLYKGPNPAYQRANDKPLSVGVNINVLARNEYGDWFLVEAGEDLQGWLYIQWIEVNFDESLLPIQEVLKSPPPTPTQHPKPTKPISYPNPN